MEEDFLDELNDEGFEMHGKIDNQKLQGPIDKGAGRSTRDAGRSTKKGL